MLSCRSGLPTAHWLGYRSGGLKALEKARSENGPSQLPQKILDSLELEYGLHCRRWTIRSQLLPTLVAAAADTLAQKLTEKNEKFFVQISRIGLLVNWSCLLSTIGKEMAMLEDFIPVIQDTRVVLQFERSGSPECDEEEKEGAIITPDDLEVVLVNSVPKHQQPGEFEITMSLPGAVFDWLESCSELHGALRVDIKPVVLLQGVNEQQTLADVKWGVTRFEEEVNRGALSSLEEYVRAFKSLSKETRVPASGSEESSLPRSIQSFSLADAGSALNAEEVMDAEDPEPGGPLPPERILSFSERTSGTEKSLDDLLLATRRLIDERSSSKEKIPGILIQGGILARRMNGARITSCKSGKDRTSMLHTLEVSQLVMHNATLNRIASGQEQVVLDHLRGRAGVRLRNCKENCGAAAYAFNSLQLKVKPFLLRLTAWVPSLTILLCSAPDLSARSRPPTRDLWGK